MSAAGATLAEPAVGVDAAVDAARATETLGLSAARVRSVVVELAPGRRPTAPFDLERGFRDGSVDAALVLRNTGEPVGTIEQVVLCTDGFDPERRSPEFASQIARALAIPTLALQVSTPRAGGGSGATAHALRLNCAQRAALDLARRGAPGEWESRVDDPVVALSEIVAEHRSVFVIPAASWGRHRTRRATRAVLDVVARVKAPVLVVHEPPVLPPPLVLPARRRSETHRPWKLGSLPPPLTAAQRVRRTVLALSMTGALLFAGTQTDSQYYVVEAGPVVGATTSVGGGAASVDGGVSAATVRVRRASLTGVLAAAFDRDVALRTGAHLGFEGNTGAATQRSRDIARTVALAQLGLPPTTDVGVTVGHVRGPSTGLAAALSIVDRLSPGPLTGDQVVVATGELAEDGRVLPVGGITEKTRAAEGSGATLFLVPPGAGAEAEREAAWMDVREVRTVAEALTVLVEFGGTPAA